MRSIRALDGRGIVTADVIPDLPHPGAGELVKWLQCAAAFGPESDDARPC